MHESIIGRLHSNGSVLRESGSELAREWFSFADKVALLNRNIQIIQHEWNIKDAEASREETGLRIIKGVYMPCYSD